ncbi:MAG TPA: 6-bladed beta-propeller, partial [Gemmatimonadales bacterium]|nr:6-bladed beta-propeller [Gemmatimonadales bacterium]
MTQTGSGSIEALVSLLLVLMVPACRGQSEPPPSSRLVLSRIAVLADEATAEFDFASSIGGWAAIPIDSGRIAFLDAGRNRIVVVDTAGRVIAAFGRQGGGPGEFANPRFLMRTDSGLAVYDGLKFALVIFDLDGRAQADFSQTVAIGNISGMPTGMAPLADGSWAYSVTEYEKNLVRESLYLRRNGVTRRLAATPESPVRVVHLPCGITMYGGPPVLWPTLRWAATPTRVAYAVTESDRVVIWDVARGDSTVVEGDAKPPRAARAAALAATTGYTVTTPGRQCAIEAEA